MGDAGAQLTAVRMLLAWATRTKRLTVNPAAELVLPRLPKRLPRAVLTISEMERVLAQPDVTTASGLRDRAILEVLYSTGIRRMELVGLDLSDLDASAARSSSARGRERRIVSCRSASARSGGPSSISIAARRATQACAHGPLGARALPRRPRAPIRAAKLTERLHQYLDAAGIAKPGSVHIFRHTMATLMHDAGADVRDLQEILGHAQLSTTEIYTHVSIERFKAVHTKTHPAHLARRAFFFSCWLSKKLAEDVE